MPPPCGFEILKPESWAGEEPVQKDLGVLTYSLAHRMSLGMLPSMIRGNLASAVVITKQHQELMGVGASEGGQRPHPEQLLVPFRAPPFWEAVEPLIRE